MAEQVNERKDVFSFKQIFQLHVSQARDTVSELQGNVGLIYKYHKCVSATIWLLSPLFCELEEFLLEASLEELLLEASLEEFLLEASLEEFLHEASLEEFLHEASLEEFLLEASLEEFLHEASLEEFLLEQQ